MYKTLLLLPFLCLATLLCIAQQDTLLPYLDKLSLKNFDTTIALAGKSLLQTKDQARQGILHRFRGRAYYFSGRYDSASTDFMHSVRLLKGAQNDVERGLTFIELAKLYRKTKMYASAIATYDSAMMIFKARNDSGNLATVYNESGVVYEYREDYQEAISRYRQSGIIKAALKDTIGMAYSANFISGVQFLQRQYDAAFANGRLALSLFLAKDDRFAAAVIMHDLAGFFLETGQTDSAVHYNAGSRQIAAELKYADLHSKTLRLSAEIQKEKGNYDSAYHYITHYEQIKDSVFNAQSMRNIAEMQEKYNAVAKDQRILADSNQINRQRIWMLLLALAAGLIGFTAYILYSRHRLMADRKLQQAIIFEQDAAAKAVIHAEENERQRMSASLHDGLGQLLSVIKMNLQAMEPSLQKETGAGRVYDNTLGLVDESIQEMRHVSHQMVAANMLKTGLGNALKSLIEKIDSNRLKVHLTMEGLQEPIDEDIQIMVYRILQESINNVIKHAGANEMTILLARKDNQLYASIADNGRGFDMKKVAAAGRGIGLRNIRTRVNFLKGAIHVESSPGEGCRLQVQIPLTPAA